MLVSPKIILVCCAYYFSEALRLTITLLSEADTMTLMIPLSSKVPCLPDVFAVMSKSLDKVVFRSSIRGKKKLEILEQWYTVSKHPSATHTAR